MVDRAHAPSLRFVIDERKSPTLFWARKTSERYFWIYIDKNKFILSKERARELKSDDQFVIGTQRYFPKLTFSCSFRFPNPFVSQQLGNNGVTIMTSIQTEEENFSIASLFSLPLDEDDWWFDTMASESFALEPRQAFTMQPEIPRAVSKGESEDGERRDSQTNQSTSGQYYVDRMGSVHHSPRMPTVINTTENRPVTQYYDAHRAPSVAHLSMRPPATLPSNRGGAPFYQTTEGNHRVSTYQMVPVHPVHPSARIHPRQSTFYGTPVQTHTEKNRDPPSMATGPSPAKLSDRDTAAAVAALLDLTPSVASGQQSRDPPSDRISEHVTPACSTLREDNPGRNASNYHHRAVFHPPSHPDVPPRRSPTIPVVTRDVTTRTQPKVSDYLSITTIDLASRSRQLLFDVPISDKPCKCKNTHCLKLYCTCFQTGNFCDPNICNCKDCENVEEFNGPNDSRPLAITEILKRRIDAFEPRLKKKTGEGCACKNSRCVMKYCDCFAIGALCSSKCTCTKCENSMKAAAKSKALSNKFKIKRKGMVPSRK